MSLERFRRTRMVVLNRSATAYQAARAMMDNHIGSILIGEPGRLVGIITDRDLALTVIAGGFDPKTTALADVMSEEVVTCDIGADISVVVQLMKEHNVRRIPVTEHGELAGLVTFDDLVVDGSVSLDALRSIVTAQLEVEAPQKPAGLLHPQGPGRPEQRPAGRARALMRAKARADATYNKLVDSIAVATGLDHARSERALLLGVCMLCRRLMPQEAQHVIAQLPSKMQPDLAQCLDGPDRSVTAEAIRKELGRALSLDAEASKTTLGAICQTLSNSLTAGQIEEVRGQLPEGMKYLFPASRT